MTIKEYVHRFFSTGYIFDTRYVVMEKADMVYMVAGLFAVIVGAAAKLMSNYSKNPVTALFWHRLSLPLIYGGVMEVIWYALRAENIIGLSAHFIAWLIGIITIVWLFFPVRYYFKEYATDTKKWEKQQINLKYIKK